VDRAGLRRKLLKAQAEAGDIVLLFGDESEALTHPYLAHAWAKEGADLRIPAPGQAAKVAMFGVLDWARRDLLVLTRRSKRSADFLALLAEIDRRWGPRPGEAMRPVVLVLDNGPIHTSKATRAALAERAHWLTVEWLPKYAPELNDIEALWRDLKQHHLAQQTFTGPEDLDRAIHDAVATLNAERHRHPLASQRRAAHGVRRARRYPDGRQDRGRAGRQPAALPHPAGIGGAHGLARGAGQRPGGEVAQGADRRGAGTNVVGCVRAHAKPGVRTRKRAEYPDRANCAGTYATSGWGMSSPRAPGAGWPRHRQLAGPEAAALTSQDPARQARSI
jgi:hypothetical protein